MLQATNVKTTMAYMKKKDDQLEQARFSPIFLSWLADQIYARLRSRLAKAHRKRDLVLVDALMMVLTFQARAAGGHGKVRGIMNLTLAEVVGEATWALGQPMNDSEVEAGIGAVIGY